MKSTLWWLGLIFGTLSVVMLVREGIEHGFVAPLEIMLDFYEKAAHVLFGRAEQPINELLATLSSYLGWQPRLEAHWKHILILVALWFGVGARHYADMHLWLAAALLWVWGWVCAASIAISAGSVPLGDHTLGLLAALFVVLIEVLGLGVYEVGRTVISLTAAKTANDPPLWPTLGESIGWVSERSLLRAMIGAVSVLVLMILLPTQGGAPTIALGVIILVEALRGVVRGERWARFNTETNLKNWRHLFFPGSPSRSGFFALCVSVGVLLFLALNAGLKLAGL